jgi:hypothetical protein
VKAAGITARTGSHGAAAREHLTAYRVGPRGRRRELVLAGVLLALCAGLWLPRLRGPLDMRYDAGVYYVLGSALAEGKGYRLLNEPGAIQAVQYPPGLALVAAAAQRLAGSSDVDRAGHLLRLAFCAAFTLYVLGVYLLGRRFLGPGFAFLAALVTALHVHTSFLSDLFFAELPFALVSVAFVLAFHNAAAATEPGPRRGWAALTGLLGVAAYLLRTLGVALLAAWVAEALLRRRWPAAARRSALALLPLLLWQGYVAHVQRGPEYAHPAYPYQRADYQYYNVGYLQNLAYRDPFVPERGKASPADWARRLAANLERMPASWGEAVSSRAEWSISQLDRLNRTWSLSIPLWLVQVPLVLLGTAILGGLLLMAWRGERLIPLYVAGSVAIMCLTPWPGQFERYLSPLTPFLAVALLALLAAVRERTPKALAPPRSRRAQRIMTALMTLMIAGILAQESFAIFKVYTKQLRPVTYADAQGRTRTYSLFFYTAAWRSQDVALAWLASHGRTGEVVATSTPHWAYLHTGLQAVMPPFEPEPAEAQRLLDAVPVTWLVVDSLEFVDLTRRYGDPVVRAFPDDWRLAFKTRDGASRIYRRTGAPPPAAAAAVGMAALPEEAAARAGAGARGFRGEKTSP